MKITLDKTFKSKGPAQSSVPGTLLVHSLLPGTLLVRAHEGATNLQNGHHYGESEFSWNDASVYTGRAEISNGEPA